MSKVSDSDTRVVVRVLAVFLTLFYTAFYAITVIVSASFGEIASYSGREPFDYASSTFGVSSSAQLVGFVSYLIAFLCIEPILLFAVVKSTAKIWDYALTLVLVHFVLACAISGAPPVNWIWWVVFFAASAVAFVVGELACYRFRDLREIPLDH
eukprot:ANDGO_07490.mRNA.1 hypothetical protein AMSG_01936